MELVLLCIVDCIEVVQFSFGSSAPHIKHVQAYECVDGVACGKRPVTWTSWMRPSRVRQQTGTCQLVLEADIGFQSDDFILVLRNHMAGKWCYFYLTAMFVLYCVIMHAVELQWLVFLMEGG